MLLLTDFITRFKFGLGRKIQGEDMATNSYKLWRKENVSKTNIYLSGC